jgi:hypothetical protein
MILWSPHQPGGGCFYNGHHPKAKDAFKVCLTPDPCLLVEGQRHKRFPGEPRTKSSILLTIIIRQIRWRVTGLPTTLDAFNAIPRWECIIWCVWMLCYFGLRPGDKREGSTVQGGGSILFLTATDKYGATTTTSHIHLLPDVLPILLWNLP